MNLIQQAENDLSFTLEDNVNGFATELTLIDGIHEYPIKCRVNDIGFFLDQQTGIGVNGRRVEIVVRISSIDSLDIPGKNWKCNYADTNGKIWTASVFECTPDRTRGIYNIGLEALKKYDSTN